MSVSDEITGVDCPKCGAPAGEKCRRLTPGRTRLVDNPHVARWERFRDSYPEDPVLATTQDLQPLTRSDLSCDCLGGGTAYVAHGEDVVLLAFTEDVDWWRNAAAFTPSEARRLAAILIRQADHCDEFLSEGPYAQQNRDAFAASVREGLESVTPASFTEGDET